ncbi:MAG TPA: oxidoreductase, partial [Candidatus Nesterenkonia stercoripullorum]|nr:oxidoreductase [Candidatus Nesterenkonia stercoripullorum]
LAGRAFAQTSAQGALPTLFAATQDLPGASYVGPDGRRELHGYPTLVGRSAKASDPETAQRLWTVSEQLTGMTFGLDLE